MANKNRIRDMTPKDKAIGLYIKYIDAYNDRNLQVIDYKFAKQCALIAVDEIIEDTNMYQYGISNALEHIPSKIVKHPYWQEVKQEIEKL